MTLAEVKAPENARGFAPNLRGQSPAQAPGKTIFFLNRYFYPDLSATSQILSDLAFHMAGTGREVCVLASAQRYDNPRARLPRTELKSDVTINRVATTRFGRSNLLGRGLDYLSFYGSAWRTVLARAKSGDTLVAKTDPPLLCVAAMQVAKKRGLRLVNWLQDLYPEVAIQLDVPFLRGPVAQALVDMRDSALRAAEMNVVVGERMAEILRARGIAAERIKVIPNWCDDEEIYATPRADNPLRRAWSLEDRFVVGYSGNLGGSHEFDTVLAAAECLRDDPRIMFLFIGGGSKFGALARQVRERKLSHCFQFHPYQPRDALKHSLGLPDVHLVSLKPEFEGLVVPSKFYGIAAAGRPMVAVTAKDGEIARLVHQHRCGTVVEPGEGADLAAVLRALLMDRKGVEEMGLRARSMLEANFSRRQAFERWQTVLAGS